MNKIHYYSYIATETQRGFMKKSTTWNYYNSYDLLFMAGQGASLAKIAEKHQVSYNAVKNQNRRLRNLGIKTCADLMHAMSVHNIYEDADKTNYNPISFIDPKAYESGGKVVPQEKYVAKPKWLDCPKKEELPTFSPSEPKAKTSFPITESFVTLINAIAEVKKLAKEQNLTVNITLEI